MDVSLLLSLVCSQVEVSAMGRSLVRRSPNDCGVCLSLILKSQLRLSSHKNTLFAVRTTWRIYIETIEDKSFTTFVRVNSLLKSGELSPLIERSFQKELLASRGGFTVKIMKLKFQGPSLVRAPYKALGGTLAMRSQGRVFCNIFKGKTF